MADSGGGALLGAVDEFVRAFEVGWTLARGGDLGRFLPNATHPLHDEVLCELVCVDLELSWRHGQPRPLADYLSRHPALASDGARLRRIAYEEYRQRLQAGERPDPTEYERRFDIPTADWEPPPTRLAGEVASAVSRAAGALCPNPAERPLVTLVPVFSPRTVGDVPSVLRQRLRLISLGVSGVLAYYSALQLVSPDEKVGLFLERSALVAMNWMLLFVCGVLTAVLWSRYPLSLRHLRQVEVALVVLLTTELAAGLFSDLFIDDELARPLAEGDHALFHYASSWTLPFFAIIVGYGALVPSTGRRCAAVVAPVALVPLIICTAAGVAAGGMGRPFLLSFLLQMTLWMVAAAAIAAYGAHRLEVLRREVSEARRLGQYRLTKLLATGGMGEVYLAEHILLRRPCAVKVIRPDMASDPHALERFEREARAVASLTHPNTVQLFDFGTAADGTFYYAMEYLPGPNLDELVRREGPLEPSRVTRLLRQVCGSLSEAHRRGLVHRDIKPSNILLCERGGTPDVAKLVDFGLVHGLGTKLGVDGEGSARLFAGTPSYASPEQAEGRKELTPQTDIYCLGAVAYFLLTGQPPFVRDTDHDTLAAHAIEPVPPLRLLRSDIPADLERVVLRCLEKDPLRRFPDAASLEQALGDCAPTDNSQSTSPGT